MKKIKHLLALLVVMALVFCLQPMTVHAADNVITVGGQAEVEVNNWDGETHFTFTVPEAGSYVVYAEEFEGELFFTLQDSSFYKSNYNSVYFEAEAGATYDLYVSGGSYTGAAQTVKFTLEKTVPASYVAFEKSNYICFVNGDTINVVANILPANGSISGTWTSSDPNVASVAWINSYRVGAAIEPHKAGTTTITFVADSGVEASCTVTVKETAAIAEGQSVTYSLATEDAIGYTFTAPSEGWYYFDRAVGREEVWIENFTLDVTGRLWSEEIGEYIGSGTENNKLCLYLFEGEQYQVVVANDTDKTQSGTLEVHKAVKATSVDLGLSDGVVMPVGDEWYFGVTYGPTYAIPEKVTSWTSSNPDVLEIVETWNESCYTVAKAEGTAVLTATTESGLTDSVTVNVGEYYFDTSVYEKTLVLNTANKVTITEDEIWQGFKFTPSATGYYQFDHDSSSQVILAVYDETEDLATGYYFETGKDGFVVYLEKGQTYYIDTYYYDYENETGSYNVYATQVPYKADGWAKCREGWYYYKGGVLVFEWQKIDGKWYYFRVDGSMVKGFREIDGATYYFGTDGAMKTGWQEVDGKWYYMDASGIMKTGWVSTGGKWYYMNAEGVMQTGWQKIDGKWYYFNSAMKTGWQKIGGSWYYLNSEMKTGWQRIGGQWYYLGGDGAMRTNWQRIGGQWYYLGSNGAMRTGWQRIGGVWYYMNTSGAMQTGWLKQGGTWYYLNSSGAMVTGTQTIGGQTYQFDSNGVWIG